MINEPINTYYFVKEILWIKLLKFKIIKKYNEDNYYWRWYEIIYDFS